MLFGCSRLPWKDEVVEEESFEQEEVEVEQLYGLHSMQGAEIKAQKNNIEYYLVQPKKRKIVKKSYSDNFLK